MDLINRENLLKEIDEEICFWEDNDNTDDSDMTYDACMVMCLQKIRRFVTKMPAIKEDE
jgi:hypothetical protein